MADIAWISFGGGGAGVAFVSVSSTTQNASGANTAFAALNPGAATFALLLCAVAGADNVTAGTFNGSAMTSTFVTASTGGGYTGMHAFYIANPTTGDVVVTTNDGRDRVYGMMFFSGVNAIGTWQNNGGVDTNTETTPSITGVDATGMFVNFSCAYGGTDTPYTFNASETDRLQLLYSGGATKLCASTKAGGASTTVGITGPGDLLHLNVAGVYLQA